MIDERDYAPLGATAPDAPRTEELLERFLRDADGLSPDELTELATSILQKSLDKGKYRLGSARS